jgi:hypothetical protein
MESGNLINIIMQTKGRFKLMTVIEFGHWLEESTFSRVIELVQKNMK